MILERLFSRKNKMANILDIGILDYFNPALVLILIFVLLYGVLEKAKLFGESKGLHALVAFVFGLIFILVEPLRELVVDIVPWFVLLFFFIIIMLIGVMMLGIEQKSIASYVTEYSGVTVTLIIIIILIFLAGLSNSFPGMVGYPENGDSSAVSGFSRIFFHPKVLGVLFIFVVGYFIVRAVGYGEGK